MQPALRLSYVVSFYRGMQMQGGGGEVVLFRTTNPRQRNRCCPCEGLPSINLPALRIVPDIQQLVYVVDPDKQAALTFRGTP